MSTFSLSILYASGLILVGERRFDCAILEIRLARNALSQGDSSADYITIRIILFEFLSHRNFHIQIHQIYRLDHLIIRLCAHEFSLNSFDFRIKFFNKDHEEFLSLNEINVNIENSFRGFNLQSLIIKLIGD